MNVATPEGFRNITPAELVAAKKKTLTGEHLAAFVGVPVVRQPRQR